MKRTAYALLADVVRHFTVISWLLLLNQKFLQHYLRFQLLYHQKYPRLLVQREYGINKTVLDDVMSKFRYASEHGNADTKKKADSMLQNIQDKILAYVRVPEPEVARVALKLQDYLPVKVQHDGWNVDSLKISLAEAEEGRLAAAKSQGYSLVTKGDFDGRAGGELVLYKNDQPVVPEKTVYVSALTLTIVGSPLE